MFLRGSDVVEHSVLYISIYMIRLYIILYYITVEGIQVLVYSLVYIHCIFMILIDTIQRKTKLSEEN